MLATWGAHIIRDALDLQIKPDTEQQVHKAIMIGIVAYVGRLAMPVVPGAEIGIAWLAGFVTVVIAVSPVPLDVVFLGLRF